MKRRLPRHVTNRVDRLTNELEAKMSEQDRLNALLNKTKREKEVGRVLTGPKELVGVPVMETYQAANPGAEEVRKVAVQFYQATLAACVTEGAALMMSTGANPDKPYPECLVPESVLDAAINIIDNSQADPSHQHGHLTAKERTQWYDILLRYIGTMFFTKLREAHIFQFKGRDYGQLFRYADMEVNLEAGYAWEPKPFGHEGEHKEPPFEQLKEVAELTIREGIKMPFPEKLPFKSCWFAWGVGLPIARMPSLELQYGLNPEDTQVLMATLVTDDGWAFSILVNYRKDAIEAFKASPALAVASSLRGTDGVSHIVVLERIGEHDFEIEHERAKVAHDTLLHPGWCLPYALVPWVVKYTVEILDRQDSLTKVQPGLIKERLAFKTLSKRTGTHLLPAPYYTVLVQPTVYEEIEHRIQSQPRKWSHRWDVMGHYAHRFARGTLPMDPKVVWNLQKRKYEVFHALNRPSPQVLEFLMRKRILPPRTGEWLALLTFHREAYIKGPEDKPYVPSVRRLKGGVPPVV